MFRFTRIALNLTVFFNVLLFFLLLFEDKIQLPVFLQVTGRMHPLVLHFPLVLLFVGIFLEYLCTRKAFQHDAVVRITVHVLLLFALSAALTALFGLFLYKEGSYQGEEVALHKWIGAAVSLLALVLVWLKKYPKRVYYYTTLGLSAVCVVVAGHLGAEVTHGKGFLVEPIQKKNSARIAQIENPDSAVIFRDVIQPILNEKCLNCHNANRAKNDLILTDYEHVMQGGETRGGVVPGKAEESLLYKYVSLPMDDTLHMPPKDKLQLDREEIRLIGWWINTGASEHEKYVHLPKADSIHTIMLTRFHPKTGLDLLNISFVDHEEIQRLNNPYRTVQQISATQPYIAVFLGSKKDFTANDLSELKKIGKQIVSVDLGNSKVTDPDLKTLSEFPHLQKVHLQYTGVGDEGVLHLKGLRFLESLNLSGTKVSAKLLDELARWENLKKLYVYNTAVGEDAVSALKKKNPRLEVYSTQIDLSDSVYNAELTPPVVKIDSAFFRSQASVDVKPSRGKVKFYYTLDGTDPSHESLLYNGPFEVVQSCELKMKATMTGWKDSRVVTFPFMKLGARPAVVKLETMPDPKHSGKLDSTLFDGKSGGLNRADKEYLGFVNRDMEVLYSMNQPQEMSIITLSFLEDISNGVFPPAVVEVWGGIDKNNLARLAVVETVLPSKDRPASKGIINVTFKKQPIKFVRLKAKNIKSLPAWHPLHKSSKASIFVDELSSD